MALVFNCCKNKTQKGWICIQCHGIFHKSCRSRLNRGVEIIEGNLIICSEECSGRVSESESPIFTSLQQTICNLKTELSSKSNYIVKLKSDHQILLQEAENLEKHLVQENNDLKSMITSLKAMNKVIPKELVSTLTQTTPPSTVLIQDSLQTLSVASKEESLGWSKNDWLLLEEELEDTKKQLLELEELRCQMQITIETQNQENIFLSSELESLKQAVSDSITFSPPVCGSTLRGRKDSAIRNVANSLWDELTTVDSNSQGNSGEQEKQNLHCQPHPASSCTNKKRVLVFGDSSARGVAPGLLRFVDTSEYSVNGESYPGFSISQMANKVFQRTTDFGVQDSIIVCINLDVAGGIHNGQLRKLLSIGKYLHLIFSLTYSNSSYNKYLGFASICHEFLQRQNASIRVLDNVIVNGRFRVTKKHLCETLYNYVNLSFLLKNVFVSSCVKYCNTVGNYNTTDCSLVCSNAGPFLDRESHIRVSP